MDVLSEVLRVVRLQGALFFNGEFSAPWCLSSALSPAVAERLAPGAGHLIIFHFLTEGRAYARLPDGTREELTAGDIVIFPHGNAHFLGNGSPEKTGGFLPHFREKSDTGLKSRPLRRRRRGHQVRLRIFGVRPTVKRGFSGGIAAPLESAGCERIFRPVA